jgi:hypothetical protein
MYYRSSISEALPRSVALKEARLHYRAAIPQIDLGSTVFLGPQKAKTGLGFGLDPAFPHVPHLDDCTSFTSCRSVRPQTAGAAALTGIKLDCPPPITISWCKTCAAAAVPFSSLSVSRLPASSSLFIRLLFLIHVVLFYFPKDHAGGGRGDRRRKIRL